MIPLCRVIVSINVRDLCQVIPHYLEQSAAALGLDCEVSVKEDRRIEPRGISLVPELHVVVVSHQCVINLEELLIVLSHSEDALLKAREALAVEVLEIPYLAFKAGHRIGGVNFEIEGACLLRC